MLEGSLVNVELTLRDVITTDGTVHATSCSVVAIIGIGIRHYVIGN